MKSLRVAAAQINSVGSTDANLEKISTYVSQAKRRKADVVLFPECTLTGYAVDFTKIETGSILEALAETGRIARRHRIHLLVGTPLFSGGKRYNALVAFDRSGEPAYAYAKSQLTAADRKVFTPGNAVAFFKIAGAPVTAIICHERRYPELVRLGAMAGAKIVFHPNAGLDSLAVSRKKRGGKDGIPARAFENAIYYVFANTVGPQGKGKWSAGDSKIVAASEKVLALADNESETLITATLDLDQATRRYVEDSFEHPAFLSRDWQKMIEKVKKQSDRFSRQLLNETFG